MIFHQWNFNKKCEFYKVVYIMTVIRVRSKTATLFCGIIQDTSQNQLRFVEDRPMTKEFG